MNREDFLVFSNPQAPTNDINGDDSRSKNRGTEFPLLVGLYLRLALPL